MSTQERQADWHPGPDEIHAVRAMIRAEYPDADARVLAEDAAVWARLGYRAVQSFEPRVRRVENRSTAITGALILASALLGSGVLAHLMGWT